MCEEKFKKGEQSDKLNDDLIKGQFEKAWHDEKTIKEGYQPTDILDTSNPPVDKGSDNTK